MEEKKLSPIERTELSFLGRRRDADHLLKLCYAALHLHEACIGSVGVIIEHVDLLLQFHISLLLIGVLTLDLLRKLELFVERLVFALDDVHLEDSAAGVLLGADDVDLAAVVLELGDDVDQDLLEALELTSERHGFFALKTKDCIACGSLANRAVTSNLAELALRVLHRSIEAT